MSDYPVSVVRAVAAHGGLREYAKIFGCLPEKVMALHPFDVVALLSAQVAEDSQTGDTLLLAKTLALRGYDSITSLALYTKFCDDYPEFCPDMMRLASRSHLIEVFGAITGELLASTVSDPKAQPMLHALLFDRRTPQLVERECLEATFVTRFAPQLRAATRQRIPHPDTLMPWQLRDHRLLPRHDADAYYYAVTNGGRLPAVTYPHLPT